MPNSTNIDNEDEKMQRAQEGLVLLAQKCASSINLNSILQESETIEEFLYNASLRIAQEFPITSHLYSLSDQLLAGMNNRMTDCRLSATAMGLMMITAGTFDEVNLMYPPSEDIHVGVIGRRNQSFYLVDFIDYGDKFRVRKSSEKQLRGKLIFPISGKGILALDKVMR